MAIYGWNFNNTAIPADVRARLKDEVVENKKHYRLQGVCNDPQEQQVMGVLCHNGTRSWVWRTEVIGAKTWYGMYVH